MRLIGIAEPSDDFPALRDGDVIHYVDPADSSSALRPGRLVLLWLICARFGVLPAATLLIGLAHATPAAPPEDPADHWLWSPYQGRLGPVQLSSGDDLRAALSTLEPIWSRGFIQVIPRPERRHVWVPRPLSSALVSVLLLGPPRAIVQMLPPVLPHALLLRIMRHFFGEVAAVAGRRYSLREPAAADRAVPLNDGDLLVAVMATWAPSIQARWPTHFGTVAEARDQGLWSHPLSFQGNGWAFMWRDKHVSPTLVPLRGKQVWDPSICVLRPAFNHLAEGWWPRLHDGRQRDPHLHFVPAHSQEAQGHCHTTCQASDGEDVSAEPAHTPWEAHGESSACNKAARPCLIGVTLAMLISSGVLRGSFAAATWSLLACYLAAWGAPGSWKPVNSVTWACSLEDTCRLQAWLHQFWRQYPLRPQLPTAFPTAYHVAWDEFPLWSGGVPQELFIATDGSGLGHGSSAFAVWALHKHRWYRIGWYASDLPSIAWSEAAAQPTGQRSFLGEIAALHSAALWALSMCDCWQFYMGCRPNRITVAVDNTSALQVAAGMASAHGRPAQWCRAGWQAVQARCSTHFRHVPSHSGFLVNTIADALADHASKFTCGTPLLYTTRSPLSISCLSAKGHGCGCFLWLSCIKECPHTLLTSTRRWSSRLRRTQVCRRIRPPRSPTLRPYHSTL